MFLFVSDGRSLDFGGTAPHETAQVLVEYGHGPIH
jgi:hypothetical protein